MGTFPPEVLTVGHPHLPCSGLRTRLCSTAARPRGAAVVFGLALLLCGMSVALVLLVNALVYYAAGDSDCWRNSVTGVGCSINIAFDVVTMVLIAWFGGTLLQRAFRICCPVYRKGNMVDLASERGTVFLFRKERRTATSKDQSISGPLQPLKDLSTPKHSFLPVSTALVVEQGWTDG